MEGCMETTFQDRLAGLLERKGMSQKKLAGKAGITEAALSRYVNGTRVPRSNVLARMALALGTTSDWLMTGVRPDGSAAPHSSLTEIAEAKILLRRNASSLTREDKLEIAALLVG